MEWRSIASRLALWVLSGSMLVLAVIGGTLLTQTRRQVLQHTHREATALAKGAASRIETRIDHVTATTRLLATLVATRTDHAEPLARDTLAANKDMAGLAIVFSPSVADVPANAPFISRGPDGKLVRRDLNLDPTRYWKQPWFLGGLSCSAGCWQRPFYSQSRHRRLVNYSVAIQRGNRPIGLVNADVTLDWLQGILGSLRKPDGAYAFVLDGDGHYLAHDHAALIGSSPPPTLLAALARQADAPVRLDAPSGQTGHEPAWIYSAPIEGTHWSLGVVVPEARIYAGLRRLFLVELVLGLLALLGIALVILVVTRQTLAPLGILVDRAEHVARGELDFELPTTRRNDEIGRLTQAFDAMRGELARYIEAQARAAREQQRLSSELEIAHQIQTALLPSDHYLDAHCATFELHAILRPARAVGGDLYSYFMLDQQRFCVMVGDVSDKGIPAALFMARTITLAKAMAPRTRSPRQLLQSLNQELSRGNESCMFVCLVCGVLDIGSGELVLASAGHEPPILCGRKAPRLLEFETGPALGLDDEATYAEYRLRLWPGDILLLYTDGITEATDSELQMYGLDRTLACLARSGTTAPAAELTGRLLADVDRFVDNASQADDITVLALNWLHPAPKGNAPVLDLTAGTSLQEVFQALERCETGMLEAGVAHAMREDVRLVLEELLVNMVEHGSVDARPEGTFRLQVQLADDTILIEVHDDGPPFDPRLAPSPTLTGDIADPEEVGGFGIHLVRAMTSTFDYSHDAQGNHLQLRFTHPAPDGAMS